jgi:two-component system chemotaxis sensor kinase CheA
MDLVLRCIDYLRQCNERLREGAPLGSAAEWIDALRQLEDEADSAVGDAPQPTDSGSPVVAAEQPTAPAARSVDDQEAGDAPLRMRVRFRAGLPLADLKAQLIVARLAKLGAVESTVPALEQLSETDGLEEFEIRIDTHEDGDRLRAAADVDGIESIEFAGTAAVAVGAAEIEEPLDRDVPRDAPAEPETEATADSAPSVPVTEQVPAVDAGPSETREKTPPPTPAKPEAAPPASTAAPAPETPSSGVAPLEKATANVGESMRVGIERLDNLMNLAGELIVNRARFVQISGHISPALRKASMLARVRDFSDGLRRTIEALEKTETCDGDRSALIQPLRAGLEMLDEQSAIWENGRDCLNQMSEAIDQLSRVSHSLQRGVLDTRMVPVGPLFNRFKRVVRDLSKERGKQVELLIRGEKTELDKRMTDELVDPLVHLVRNSIDHGLEPPAVRVRHGKPETGTIVLEASHSGNNIYIHVRDDGGGIDFAKVKAKLVDSGILTKSEVEELTYEQALDYVWHPGFSTAAEVTDVSGRGVGMDVVKTRITQLNGTIEVDSTPQQGTSFTLRLPLTLAIIDCLLARLREVTFSMPIDDVREIVSVNEGDVVTVQGKQTFDVRGEFIPLVRIEDVFQWHGIDYGYGRAGDRGQTGAANRSTDVVILQAAGRTIGLQVDELLGSQDMVIKSLADNFISLRGLSGASILGDGSVCLMLDVGSVIDMATAAGRPVKTKKVAK